MMITDENRLSARNRLHQRTASSIYVSKRSSDSLVAAFKLSPTPRLSYRTEAIPCAANPSARYFRLLLAPLIAGELPSRSVGPEPAIINAIGDGDADIGSSRSPKIFPVGVSSMIGSDITFTCNVFDST